MPGIYYSIGKDDVEVGRWSGKSIRNGTYVTKEKQLYLGKVIDKDRLIFYKRDQGFYQFDPTTLAMNSVPDAILPHALPQPDRRLRDRNVIVNFGGSYFLQELITHIEYHKVLDSIETRNPDTLYGLLHFYALSPDADCNALSWYQNSYARFLFPRANLSSQRISDFYVKFGSENNHRIFFEKHIQYVSSVTDDEYAILIDSTGCQNVCGVPITKISKHNNEINVEFRVIVVVQRSTGIPVYYELIPGNVVDSTTISRIIRMMNMYGYRITHISGDAGYSCPSNLEKVIISGSDLVMRLNPTYDLYKDIAQEYRDDMNSSKFNADYDIHYRNRVVRVIKVSSVIGEDENGIKLKGFVYLCKDLQAYHSKSDHFMKYHGSTASSAKEIVDQCDKFGEFAIVTTENHDPKDIIATYYIRQSIEQFFDYAKNLGKLMPVRNHNLETIKGHMQMSFITTFLMVVIKNKMNIMDVPYVAIPDKLKGDGDTVLVDSSSGRQENIVAQEPVRVVFRSNPAAMFAALNFVGADVFDNRSDDDNQIIPSVPYRDANDYFKAFGIPCPEAVLIRKDRTLKIILKKGLKISCKKAKIFSKRPYVMVEDIETAFKEKQADANDNKSTSNKCNIIENEDVDVDVEQKHGRGRRKGSKNKKTLEREAEMAAKGIVPVKRKPGRPKGSKDKVPRKKRGAKRKELSSQ